MGRKKQPAQQDITVAAYEALIERHGGRISPRILVDEARDESSPFHSMFEWDDEVAGDHYRLVQASQIIRRWKGTVMRVDQTTRTVQVTSVRRVQSPKGDRTKGGASYQPIEQIMENPEKRDDLVQTVLRELQAYRKRYSEIVALADVWRAIDDAVELYAAAATTKRDRPGDESPLTV